MQGIAQDLRQAIKNLNPQDALEVDELKDYFIDRTGSPIHKLMIDLELMETADNEKILFTGHRGSGKSTELAKLEALLDGECRVIRFAVTDYLDIQDLDYRDVLFAIFFAIADYINEKQLEISKPVQNVIEQLWDFDEVKEITADKAKTKGAEAEYGFAGFLGGVFGIKAKFKSQNTTRESIRKQVNRKIQELLNGLDDLLREIERIEETKVLFIVEALDKTDLAIANEIFFRHSQSLTAPRALIIYTFPIALLYSDDFTHIRNSFKVYKLPNFKLHLRNDDPNPDAVAALKEILLRRISPDLFETEALEALVAKSNGIPRILIQLTRGAAVNARVNEHEKITLRDAEKAIAEERDFYSYMLNDERKKILKEVHETKEVDNEDEYRILMHTLGIIEYQNDDKWHDVNSLLLDLL